MVSFILSIAIITGLFFTIFFIYDKPLWSYWSKGLASFCFLVLGISAYIYNTNAPRLVLLMVIGSILGLMGDLFLHLKQFKFKQRNLVILFGIIAFSVAQIFYYTYMVIAAGFSIYPLIFGLAFTLLIFVAGKITKMEFGKLIVPAHLYGFLLSTVVGQALVFMLKSGISTLGILWFVGFLAFLISDLFLSFIYFGKKDTKTFQILNHAFYYSAQILIMFGIFFF